MSVVGFWDDMYRDVRAPTTFGGGNPSAYVVETAEMLPTGARVLDIACGDGRNALYLASRGFCVRAIDISPVAISKLKQFADERELVVDASVQDLRRESFETHYDLIVCLGSLHLVERDEWQALLDRVQQHTLAGGYNVIGGMTDALPAPDDQKALFIGLLKEGELFEYYANWEILRQRSIQFRDEHPNGSRHHHADNTVFARKACAS